MSSIKFLKRRNILEEVYKASVRFLNPLDIEETYKIFMEEVLRLSNGSAGSIFLFKNRKVVRVFTSDPLLLSIKPRAKGYIYKSFSTQVPLLLTNKQVQNIHPEFKAVNAKYNLIIPLINRGKSIGVFTALTNKKVDRRTYEALQLFSPFATLAIKKSQLYDEIKTAIETRDLFVSLASHELRTPITTTYIYLQIIERNYKKNNLEVPQWVDNIKQEMERLTQIVDEILEINQIKTGKLSYTFEECNLDEILPKSISMIKRKFRTHKFAFIDSTTKSDKIIIGDNNKLIELFINILDNAAKHSPINSTITIEVGKDKKYLIISIQDKGSGINKQDLSKIFVDFYKGKNNTKPGMGLGLYLAKQIVDKHRGRIKVTSKINVGTKVEISLPIIRK